MKQYLFFEGITKLELISEKNNIKVHLKSDAKVKGKDFHRFFIKPMHIVYVNRYLDDGDKYILVIQNSNVFTKKVKEYEFKVIRHAKWEPDPDSPPRHRCSNCHSNPYDNEADQILFRADFKEYLTKYCFDCGCKMDMDDDSV